MKKAAILITLFTVLFTLSSCSSSGYTGYNGGYEQWKKDNHYDRHFSNDEIHDFVNNYGGKW